MSRGPKSRALAYLDNGPQGDGCGGVLDRAHCEHGTEAVCVAGDHAPKIVCQTLLYDGAAVPIERQVKHHLRGEGSHACPRIGMKLFESAWTKPQWNETQLDVDHAAPHSVPESLRVRQPVQGMARGQQRTEDVASR